MANCKYYIYITTDNENVKNYIGQSVMNNPYYLGSGTLIKQVMKQKGRKNFERKLLKEVDSKDDANFWERFYIKLFSTNDLNFGYNVRRGGENSGFSHTPEAIDKIRQRSLKDDNRRRIRAIQKIATSNRIGAHMSNFSKKKSMKTRFKVDRVIQIFDNNNEFVAECNFAKEAGVITNCSRSAVSNVLCGLSKTSNNYSFKYKEL